jgi:hypothetical protein
LLLYLFLHQKLSCNSKRERKIWKVMIIRSPLKCNEMIGQWWLADATPVLVFLYTAFGVTKRNDLYTSRCDANRLMGINPRHSWHGCSSSCVLYPLPR